MDEYRIIQELMTVQRSLMEKLDAIHSDLSILRKGANILGGETLMSREEVCQVINVGIRQLSRLRASGEIEAIKIGCRTFYRTSEIQRFIKTHKSQYHGK